MTSGSGVRGPEKVFACGGCDPGGLIGFVGRSKRVAICC